MSVFKKFSNGQCSNLWKYFYTLNSFEVHNRIFSSKSMATIVLFLSPLFLQAVQSQTYLPGPVAVASPVSTPAVVPILGMAVEPAVAPAVARVVAPAVAPAVVPVVAPVVAPAVAPAVAPVSVVTAAPALTPELVSLAVPLSVATIPATFPASLFYHISSKNPDENLVISPFSIRAALTLLYMGAGSDTAEELRTVLQYASTDKIENAKHIANIFNSKTDQESKLELQMANRIYTRYEIVPQFNEIASKYFHSDAVVVNFVDNEGTAAKINSWLEGKTNNKIKDLVDANSFNAATSAILVNAIYFRAAWKYQFSKLSTTKQSFWINSLQFAAVDMMSAEVFAQYGEFPDLDATAIELKYEDNDMALLVVLPNVRDGLRALEAKFSTVDLTQLSGMYFSNIVVKLPKFKIQFEIDLIPVLTEMGMLRAFNYSADYSELFISSLSVRVNNVVHKAYIDISEFGSEAAASTHAVIEQRMLQPETIPRTFTADHPFVFAIKNKEAVYFMGHFLGI